MYRLLFKAVFPTLLVFVGQFSHAQSEDYIQLDSAFQDFPRVESFQSVSKLDPNKAAFYSAVVPGLGQIYNKQYWKIPIILGGAMVIGHYIKYNHDFFNAFRNAYLAVTDENPDTQVGEAFQRWEDNPQTLQFRAERFKRDRDFLIIIGGVLYILNIVDAHVSAHLSEFEINDDLSFMPSFYENSMFSRRNIGFSLSINLSK